MNFRADLHCHSTFSDGSASPEELIDLAKERGLSGLSITDHDSVLAYTPELFSYAEKKEIRLLTGVEFSSCHLGYSVHILGYHLSLEDPLLKKFCQRHIKRRLDRNKEILERLTKLGMPISEQELYTEKNVGVVGRPHIAKLLIEKGYVESFGEAFHRFIAEGKCCYVKGTLFSTQETIDVIHHAGGKAFIAHPHLIDKKGLLKELLKLPFDGMECYYAIFRKNQEKRWLDLAEKHNFLISGGSDFHGDVKAYIPLGCSWVDEETFNKIVS